MYNFSLRSRKLETNKQGLSDWVFHEEKVSLKPEETAFCIVDMWDKHWCSGANIRGAVVAENIDKTARIARNAGSLIIHAPSDVVNFYAESPARKRLLAQKMCEDIPNIDFEMFPGAVDASDGGSDSQSIDEHAPNTGVWFRQTEKIFIDEEKDIIGDEGELIYSYLKESNIKNIIYAGVHTNMCVMYRTFAIIAMKHRGLNPILCRDLTDCMYNPAKPPYVSHDEGLRLVIEHIESFYAPTVTSGQIV